MNLIGHPRPGPYNESDNTKPIDDRPIRTESIAGSTAVHTGERNIGSVDTRSTLA